MKGNLSLQKEIITSKNTQKNFEIKISFFGPVRIRVE
jgi:hypothetical protein